MKLANPVNLDPADLGSEDSDSQGNSSIEPKLVNASPERDGSASEQRRHLGRNRPVILVADDDPMIRLLAEESLTEKGFAVLQAENGEEALAIIDAGNRWLRALLIGSGAEAG